jgi:hypothetical protein
MFLKHEDLENVRVSSLLSLVANRAWPHRLERRYNGTAMIQVSLGSIKEPLRSIYYYYYCYYFYYWGTRWRYKPEGRGFDSRWSH